MGTALAFALSFMDRIPGLISAGMSVVNVVKVIGEHKALQDVFAQEKRDPTSQEWDAMNARLDSLEDQLQKP